MSARPRRVLVLATEIVPLPGLPTNGGGLRGWTLARGLESAGLDVALAFPREPLDALAPALDRGVVAAAMPQTFPWADPGAAIREHAPDVVVCCSWFLAARLGPCPVPLAVDLAGPILLEFLYQDRAKAREFAASKPRGLALADFVTCAGERQRAYFYPWLTLAGFEPDDLATRVAVVPISVAPDPAAPIAAPGNAEPSILCAGVALPWQDPLVPLRATLETLERRGRGTLDLFLYAHPEHSRGVRWLDRVREEATRRPRLRLHPERQRPYAELLGEYRRADLAFDLFARNPEREIAVNTRTVDYLACGLPPLYNDYAELAGPIARYDAGFVVDPADADAVGAAVGAALDDPAGLAARRANARRLADERLTWDRTVAPLAAWCAQGGRRTRRPDALSVEALVPGRAEADAALATARETSANWQRLAEEREDYAHRVEAAWQERGAALAASTDALAAYRRAPWRAALRHTLGGPLARLRGRGAAT
jgi:glycosyltransferase involved in cell wall biosynthesis